MFWIFEKFKSWIIIAAGVIFSALVIYAKGRGDGKSGAENKRLKDRLEAIIESEKIEDRVRVSSEDDLDRELSGWMRDKKR